VQGALRIWAEPFVVLHAPKLFNLRTDPFERADITSNTCYDWFITNDTKVGAGQAIATAFLQTFAEFPPRQRVASFGIGQAIDTMNEALSGAQH